MIPPPTAPLITSHRVMGGRIGHELGGYLHPQAARLAQEHGGIQVSDCCRICGRTANLNGTGDMCLRPSFTDTDAVAATCYRLGYLRERRAANDLAHVAAEQAAIIREVRDRGDAELVNAVLRANGRESARREKAEADNDELRDLLRRLSEWDHMDGAGDGPFWRREIAKTLGMSLCDYATESGAYRCTLPQGHTEWHNVEPNHSSRPVCP